jgi:hypothetical protein
MENIVAFLTNPTFAFGVVIVALLIVAVKRHAAARKRLPVQAASQPTAPVGGRSATAVVVQPDPRSPYERIPTLLTPAERDFFAVLREATPSGLDVFAQVRLAGLVQVKPAARRDKSHWWRIQAKCLDFVLVDAVTFTPRLVVELDDASHDRADRRARDVFVDDVLANVGISILHVRWQRRYDPRMLASQITTKLGHPSIAPEEVPTPVPALAALSSIPTLAASVPAPSAVQFRPASPVAPTTPIVAASTIVPAPVVASRRACGTCQAELREGAKFCAQCGAVFAM